MNFSSRVQQALHRGQEVAAEIPLDRPGWHAWLLVKPRMRGGVNLRQQLERWTRTREAGAPYDDTIVGYQLRYTELSDWHLQDEWAGDRDIAMAQRPVRDWLVDVRDESELLALLSHWLNDLNELGSPAAAHYPFPPIAEVTVKKEIAEVLQRNPGPSDAQ